MAGSKRVTTAQRAGRKGPGWHNARVGRITIEQVAAQAGVSVTTVSHVFSGKRPVKPATRAHVEKVARALGYTPNAIAASLRVQRTNTAMVMIPDPIRCSV